MTIWTEFESLARRIIQDDIPDSNGDYLISSGDLMRYCNYALDWAANRHAPSKRATLDVDPATRIALVPSDAYRILSVNSFGVDLRESGSYSPDHDEYSHVSDLEILVGDVGAETVNMSYLGEWDWIALPSDTIPGPRWLEEALLNYTASLALSQRAVSSGNIGQWDTKVDSGNPEDNPLLRLAEHYMKMAESVLNRRQQR